MGHNPATRDVKTSDRKKAEEKRTPDEIIKGIRGNLVAHLSVTPNDIAFLLAQYDGVCQSVIKFSNAIEAAETRAEVAESDLRWLMGDGNV
jgi:hypothetical protein